ncbi:MAG: lamin tail domain-containing protein, partial [Pedobacter sp.]
RIDAFSKCHGLFNWTASKNSSGGTPGRQNSVHALNIDLEPFKSDSIHRESDSTLHIYFNKYPDTGSIQATNFKLNPEAGQVQKISAGLNNSKELIIEFSKKFKAGNNYTLSLSSIKDCSGNILSSASSEFSFSLALQPPPAERPDTAKIFITEIFADPSPEVGLPLVEFVEIFNPGKDTIDLEGWSLNDPQTKSSIKSSLIAPKQYLVLCPAADTAQYKYFGKTTGISPWPSLSNSSDQVILKSFKNRIVDSISYSDH